MKEATDLFSSKRKNDFSNNNPGFDTALAAVALGHYLPFALQNRNLTPTSLLNPNSTLLTNSYPFQPFPHNLSSLSISEKTHKAFSAYLASTSEATSNKTRDLDRQCKEMLSKENDDMKGVYLQEHIEASDPIDLSSSKTICGGSTGSRSNLDTSRSDINDDEDDENVDILSIDPPASPSDVERWSVNAVVEFVSNVESCQDYQEVSFLI